MTDTTRPWAHEKTEAATAANADEELVLAMLAALSDADAPALEGYFTPDAMYQNMPLPPAYGREAVIATLAGLFTALSVDRIDTYYLASRDGFVLTERMDLLTAKHNGKSFELPVAGVFQVADGRIVAWRDYFDLREFEEAVELPLRG
jgi:limonene-1,2-epoxide hydrolase